MEIQPTLRVATVADAELISALAARLFEQTFGAANTVDDMQAYLASAFTPDVQRKELQQSDRTFFIAELDGEPVGYSLIRRDSKIESVVAACPAEVERIYVDRTLHGKKVGDQLMNACVERAKRWGSDVLWLAVWEENPRAIAFYERRGFRRVGKKTFQLGADTQHDYVMALALS